MNTIKFSTRKICLALRRHNGTLVKSEIRNNIGVITLNDPKRLNALTEKMGMEFVDTVNLMNDVLLNIFSGYIHDA